MEPTISDEKQFGLRSDWKSVQETLEEIIPIYDKTNRFISLGTDIRIRRRGLELLQREIGHQQFSLLDLGTGTGRMMQLYLEKSPGKDPLLLIDPIPAMMKIATMRTKQSGLLAVYENLPIRNDTFDSVVAGFSLRDARDLSKALSQVNRLLKVSGKFLIVDLAKPDSLIKSRLISFYWRAIAPTIAFFSSGTLGLKFGALWTTYKRLPKISDFLVLASRTGFRVILSEFYMLGGAAIIVLSKESDDV